MVLQLEDVLVPVVVIQLDARLLGSPPGLSGLLLADKGGSGRGLGNADARQASFLQGHNT